MKFCVKQHVITRAGAISQAMTQPSDRFLQFSSQVIVSAMLASSTAISAAAGATYIDKPLGAQAVRLPMLPAFPAVGEDGGPVAERMMSLALKSSIFVTRFLPAAKWQLVRDQKPSDLYPYISVSIDHVSSSGPFTSEEFQHLREATRARFGDLRAKNVTARRDLRIQDAITTARGGDLRRECYRHQSLGLFDLPSNVESFSFLVNRLVKASEACASEDVCEMISVTTIPHAGRLVRASVIDECSSAVPGLRA